MREQPTSSARLRRIGRELREIREAAGLTLQAAGRRLERAGSSLSLIENGRQHVRVRDLKHILDVYAVPDPLRTTLLTLADQNRRPGWWDGFKRDLSPAALDYVSLESDAAVLDSIETSFIPGLLQTEEYARAIMKASLFESPLGAPDRLVAFRLARQQILCKPEPPSFRVIIDEAALRRERGGRSVMRAQLKRLLDESLHGHIAIQVLPFITSRTPGVNGSFSMIEIGRPSILSAVLIDHLTGRLILEKNSDVRLYREASEHVSRAALSEPDSRTLIQRIVSEL